MMSSAARGLVSAGEGAGRALRGRPGAGQRLLGAHRPRGAAAATREAGEACGAAPLAGCRGDWRSALADDVKLVLLA